MEMKYLEHVVWEAMRLHPVAPTHARICNTNFEMTLPNGQTVWVPKGMNVWIPVRSIQRDPEYYPNPEEFFPERFDEMSIKEYGNRCVLLSFGQGPRTCLGLKFGLAQIKSCVANMLLKYEICVDPKTPEQLTYNPEELNMVYNETVYLKFRPLQEIVG